MINRKFVIIALSLLIGGSAFASGGTYSRTGIVPPTKSHGGWFIGASAFYLKPTIIKYYDYSFSSSGYVIKPVKTDYNWGFDILRVYFSISALIFKISEFILLISASASITSRRYMYIWFESLTDFK